MSGRDRDFQAQVNACIDRFVAELTELAHQHAYHTLAEALAMVPSKIARPTQKNGVAASQRRKRGQAELAEVMEELLAVISRAPGQRMQDLAATLSTTPKELALPARRLIAEKRVRTEGQKRSTAYFPTGGAKKA